MGLRKDRMMEPQFYRIKVAILGLYGVGKTALITRATRNEFDYHTIPTLGAMYNSVYMTRRDEEDAYHMAKKQDFSETCQDVFKFDVWDTAGQERYRSLLPMYYRGAEIIIFVHDGSYESKEALREIVKDVRDTNPDKTMTLGIVQNKADIKSIKYQKEFNESFNMDLCVHVSAKSGQGVKSFMETLFRKHIHKIPKQIRIDSPVFTLELTPSARRRCCSSSTYQNHQDDS